MYVSTKLKIKIHSKITYIVIRKKKNFVCQTCSYLFCSRGELTRHMKFNTDLRPFKCAEKFFNRTPPHTCDICGYKSKYKSDLKNHLIRHVGTKTFECKHCSKTFFTITELTGHIRVYTGERPYKCDICSWSFAERSNLMKHIQLRIRKSKPSLLPTYECYICGDAVKYKRKNYLKIHMREFHVDGTPYACNICSSKFSYRRDLNKHLKVHETSNPPIKATSTNKLYKCSFCDY